MGIRTRHIKGKYSWLKHLDFMALDVLALMVSLVLAYAIRFKTLDLWTRDGWRGVMTVICLLDLVVILFTGPFSGIFRRYGSEELLCTIRQAVYNFILCCILLYILKIGAAYSRAVILMTYGFYLVISLALRMLWKGLLCSGRATSVATTEKTIFVLGSRADMPQLLRSINSGFFKEYAVKGICILDGEPGEKVTVRIDRTDSLGRVQETYEEFENSTDVQGIVEYILKNHIEELFVGTKPSELSHQVYQTLIDNGKSIHLSIQPMVGRNDELYHPSESVVQAVRKELKIPDEKKIILYAPTWRDSTDGGSSYQIAPPMNLEHWKDTLGGEYVLLFRMHHLTTKLMGVQFNDFVRDVSNYPQINNLMIAADILISDYSATIFDYSILEKPIISFAYDLEEYSNVRGFYEQLDKDVLPGDVFKTENEIIQHIQSMDYAAECKRARHVKEKYVNVAGNATKACIDFLINQTTK